MPIGLGLASSHAGALFRPAKVWPAFYRWLTEGVPQPHQATEETEEVIQSYVDRIERAFSVLRGEMERYRPDALIIVGDDQGTLFDKSNMPSFGIYIGPEVWGSLNLRALGEPEEENHITLRCHQEIASYLAKALIEQGFDLSWSKELRPMGKPKYGIAHAFTHPMPKLMPKLDIPVVPIFVNDFFPPLPTGPRCYELGKAIARALEKRAERVAIYASGGLSHDPRGPRAGWIDEPLDRWVLERLSEGNGEALCHLFTFDSDTLRGGSGEIRNWIIVAGACEGARSVVVDYIPAHHAVTGLGFAYWPPQEIDRTR